MTAAIDGLRAMLKRPGFWNARLEDIGAELGVTRERARQVIEELGISKPRHQPLAWLHQMPTVVLLATFQMAGSGVALSRKWKLQDYGVAGELKRRGVKAPVFERPMSLRQLKIVDRKAWNAINTARCVAYYQAHIEQQRAYAREYRRLHPEVGRLASAKYYEKKRADPVWCEAQRVRDHARYQAAKAT